HGPREAGRQIPDHEVQSGVVDVVAEGRAVDAPLGRRRPCGACLPWGNDVAAIWAHVDLPVWTDAHGREDVLDSALWVRGTQDGAVRLCRWVSDRNSRRCREDSRRSGPGIAAVGRLAVDRDAPVARLGRPARVEIAGRSRGRRRVAVVAEGGVLEQSAVRLPRDRNRHAPGRAAVARLHHVSRVERGEPRRASPEHVQGSVWTHDRAGALPVEDVPRDELGRSERRAPVARGDERDRRLDVIAGARAEEEARPGYVDAVLEWTSGVRVDRNPLLVVEGRGRGRRVDERRRTPAQAAAAEGALAHLDRVRRTRAIEPEPGEVDMTFAVEGDRGVTGRVVLPTGEAVDPRNDRAEMSRVGRR